MLTRIWRTEFDPDQLDSLQRFAEDVSAPMFRSLEGCIGHLYAVRGATWITQTFWTTAEALDAAERSGSYRSVVDQITAAGFLVGEQRTEVFRVTGWSPPRAHH